LIDLTTSQSPDGPAPTSPERPTSTASSILPEVARILRVGRMSPAAFARAYRLSLRRGGAQVAALPELRRSFVAWGVALSALLLGCDAWLAIATEPVAGVAVGGAQVLWGAAALALARSQLGLVRDPEGRPFHGFGIANALTLLRLASLPTVFACVVLLPDHPEIGVFTAIVYGVAAGSDLLDGLLARVLKHRTDFGRVWDPVVDIVFNPVAAVALAVVAAAPWWLAVAVVYRYWAALLGGVALYIFRGPYRLRPTLIGKLSGFLLAWVLGFDVVELVARPEWLTGSTLLTLNVVSAALTGANGVYLTIRGILYRDVLPHDAGGI
jgi:phosphatidylglycerophosphate synthase